MKNYLLFALLFIVSNLHSQTIEVGFLAGTSVNSSSKKSNDYKLGNQVGFRLRSDIYKGVNLQVRLSNRSLNFKSHEAYVELDIVGMPVIKWREVTDHFNVIDYSILGGIRLFKTHYFDFNILAGGGSGRIINSQDNINNQRLLGLLDRFNLLELGAEFHFNLSEKFAFVINPQFFTTSFYTREYGENYSYQFNMIISYVLFERKNKK